MKINYNHLRYFWVVAKEGNLTRAAQQLNLSQSALSAQIKTLESQLNHGLFHRVGKRLELTESGQLVLDYAEAIYNTGDELLHKLSTGLEVARPMLRIGAISTLSRNFQLAFVKPLWDGGKTALTITSGSLDGLISQLEQHHLDVVLTNTVPVGGGASRLVVHRVSDQPVGLMGDPAQNYRGRSLESLVSEEPLVLPTGESNVRLAFDAFVERKGLKPNIAAEVSDMTMLRLLAREKIGLTLVPRIVVKEELEQGLLQEVQVLPLMKETFHAVTLKRRFPHPLLQKLLSPLD